MNYAVGDVIEVRCVGKLDNQDAINVWHFKATAAGDSIEEDLILALIECIITTILPKSTDDYSFDKVQYMRVSPTSSALLETAVSSVGAAPAAGDGVPGFCAALISLKTEFPGKSGRGRKYIAGIPEVATDAGRLVQESDYWAQFIAFVLCLSTKFITTPGSEATTNFVMQVLSRKLGNPKAPYNADQFHNVVTCSPNQVIASMRSRKIGHGS
jgi:hypothetical protein